MCWNQAKNGETYLKKLGKNKKSHRFISPSINGINRGIINDKDKGNIINSKSYPEKVKLLISDDVHLKGNNLEVFAFTVMSYESYKKPILPK